MARIREECVAHGRIERHIGDGVQALQGQDWRSHFKMAQDHIEIAQCILKWHSRIKVAQCHILKWHGIAF